MVALASPWQGYGIGLVPGQFRVVNVNVHQHRRLSGGVAQGEAGADPDDHVGGLHHVE